ncbi:MAG: RNA 2',3'-cyclic phosphodiesterase [archaeon]
MKRIFVAIELPEHVKAKLFKKFDNLPRDLFIGKKTEKENLHLTLKFLGWIDEDKIEETKNKLKKIKFGRFFGKIGDIGFFDNENHIRFIWVELLAKELDELQKKVSAALPEFFDEKGFSSHITLARVKSVPNKKRLMEETGKINFKKLDFEIRDFVLMKSEIISKNRKYKVIEKFPLL